MALKFRTGNTVFNFGKKDALERAIELSVMTASLSSVIEGMDNGKPKNKLVKILEQLNEEHAGMVEVSLPSISDTDIKVIEEYIQNKSLNHMKDYLGRTHQLVSQKIMRIARLLGSYGESIGIEVPKITACEIVILNASTFEDLILKLKTAKQTGNIK